MHVKKGDNVIVLTGKDKGKRGQVVKAMPQKNMVIIEGINMKKKHKKPTRTTKGQTIELAFPLHISNVKLASEKAPKKQKAVKKKA